MAIAFTVSLAATSPFAIPSETSSESCEPGSANSDRSDTASEASVRVAKDLQEDLTGEIIDGNFVLACVLAQNSKKQERIYSVIYLGGDYNALQDLEAKEYVLVGIPASLYQSRRRNIKRLAKSKRVVHKTNFEGRKIIIYATSNAQGASPPSLPVDIYSGFENQPAESGDDNASGAVGAVGSSRRKKRRQKKCLPSNCPSNLSASQSSGEVTLVQSAEDVRPSAGPESLDARSRSRLEFKDFAQFDQYVGDTQKLILKLATEEHHRTQLARNLRGQLRIHCDLFDLEELAPFIRSDQASILVRIATSIHDLEQHANELHWALQRETENLETLKDIQQRMRRLLDCRDESRDQKLILQERIRFYLSVLDKPPSHRYWSSIHECPAFRRSKSHEKKRSWLLQKMATKVNELIRADGVVKSLEAKARRSMNCCPVEVDLPGCLPL